MNKLAVVVLNWNGADIIEKCLESLLKQSYKDYKIIVVDNNSQDNSHEVLEKIAKKHSEKIHIIYNSKNSGFAGGVNIGIKYAIVGGYNGVALFNSDAVAEENWLKNLARVLSSKKDVGIATGLLLHEDGKTIDSTGDWYSKWGLSFPRNRDDIAEKAENSGYVFSGSGGASLYRIDTMKQIGLFDETFFAYYEDVDVGFRAQLAGWKVYYTKSAVAYHEQGGTSKKIPGFTIQQTFRNLPMLYIKNVPRGFLINIGVRLLLAYWLMLLNTMRHGNFFYAVKGWLLSIVLLPLALLKRYSVQRSKKVDKKYLQNILWQDLPPEQTGMRKFRKIFTLGRVV